MWYNVLDITTYINLILYTRKELKNGNTNIRKDFFGRKKITHESRRQQTREGIRHSV